MKSFESMGLRHINGVLEVLDQQRLPHKEEWIRIDRPEDMISAIRLLKVRGAPLIGVAAAMALAKYSETGAAEEDVKRAALALREARPTAINLMHAMDRMLKYGDWSKTAEAIFEEDVLLCEKMASNGADLIADGDNILTHCNTGGLATAGAGTALAVIRKAFEQGKKIHVWVDETRPLLQGGRLTSWELKKLSIPFTLICDNMAAVLMREGKVQKVFLGSDRIAANGDFANKIGTYNVAVNAHFHKVPFYVVAPHTTLDPRCQTGKNIPVEERTGAEVRGFVHPELGVEWSPKGSHTWNPSFDVTPRELVTGYVLDRGYFSSEEVARKGLL